MRRIATILLLWRVATVLLLGVSAILLLRGIRTSWVSLHWLLAIRLLAIWLLT